MEDRLIKLEEVLYYLPFGKTKMYELMKTEPMLKPLKVGGTNLWRHSRIQEFINHLEEEI